MGPLALDVSGARWAATHAALPAPEPVGAGRWNLYLSARDSTNRARIGQTVLALDPVPTLAPLQAQPVLDLGAAGAFDEDGVTVSCVVAAGGRRFLYYTGWQRGEGRVRFTLSAGLAIDDGDGVFRRASPTPMLEKTDAEALFTASPFVLHEGDRWRMWYVGGSEWRLIHGRNQPCYDLRYAESSDGITWRRMGRCVDPAPGEYAFGRPWVIREPGRYLMWFSVRGDRYQIGSAESCDGRTWCRTDDASGLAPAAEGWDSEMVEYPAIVDTGGRRYMLYNGNDFGGTGVGIAEWAPGSRRPPR